MNSYKGIVFSKGYNRSFEEFKELYASNHIFKNIPHKSREAELKTAYKIATENGNNLRTAPKSKSPKPEES